MAKLDHQDGYACVVYSCVQPIVTYTVSPELGKLTFQRFAGRPWVSSNAFFQKAQDTLRHWTLEFG